MALITFFDEKLELAHNSNNAFETENLGWNAEMNCYCAKHFSTKTRKLKNN